MYTDDQIETGRWVRNLDRRFYDTKEWRKKRLQILKANHYECQNCLYKYGRYGRATTVHHIKHLEDFPELAFTDSNLMALCAPCHNEMHPEKQRFKRKRPAWTNEERW